MRKIAPELPDSRLFALVAVGLLLCGCADVSRARRLTDLPPPKGGRTSEPVLAASGRPTTAPTFQDIPPLPQDVRPDRAWGTAVRQVKADGVQLRAQVAAIPPPPADTAQFAATAAAEANPPPAPVQTDTAAFAAALRQQMQGQGKPK